MSNIPETSTTLLKDLARDSQHARWGEFVARYRPMMESFMSANFPTVDAADAVQETLIALIETFPVYRYVPEEKGSFHNYLTGILRHKALKMLAKESHRSALHEAYAKDAAVGGAASGADDGQWRDALFEIALQQFMADDTVADRTKRIFARRAHGSASSWSRRARCRDGAMRTSTNSAAPCAAATSGAACGRRWLCSRQCCSWRRSSGRGT